MSANITQSAAARRRSVSDAQTKPLKLDLQLIAIIATFLLLGLFMVFSASYPRNGTYYFLRQLQWVALGLLVCFVGAAIPFKFWQKFALPVMLGTLALLIAVLAVGFVRNGATRSMLNGSLQPSEVAKLGIAVYVSAWAAAHGKKVATTGEGFLPFMVILGAVVALIALERSFSVTIIVLVIGLTIYFVGGGNVKQMILLSFVGVPALLFAMWKVGYPFDRIQGWYNVWFNPSQAPEDLRRLTEMLREGRGIGADPSVWNMKASVFGLWNDYLFANIGADLHVIGTLLVLFLYIWFGYRAITIALNSPNSFGRLLATGITAWILVQAAIHIGTSLALIPTTGQPLPFMSYGGSALLSCMAAAGLLLSISRESTEKTTAYATIGFGWRDWWTRLSQPSGDKRARNADRSAKAGSTTRRNAAANRRRSTARRSATSRAMASSVRRVAGPGKRR